MYSLLLERQRAQIAGSAAFVSLQSETSEDWSEYWSLVAWNVVIFLRFLTVACISLGVIVNCDGLRSGGFAVRFTTNATDRSLLHHIYWVRRLGRKAQQ